MEGLRFRSDACAVLTVPKPGPGCRGAARLYLLGLLSLPGGCVCPRLSLLRASSHACALGWLSLSARCGCQNYGCRAVGARTVDARGGAGGGRHDSVEWAAPLLNPLFLEFFMFASHRTD